MALLGVPALRADPAGRAGRELQCRPLDFPAGENPVAASEVLIELGFRHFVRLRIFQNGALNRIHREAPQVFPQVAVRIEIPVIPIVHQALRGDFTLGHPVVVPVVMADPEARALQQRRRDDAEPRGVALPAFRVKDADARLDLLPGMIAPAQDRVQPLDERGDLPIEQARLQIAEELQGRQQRVDLGRIEPEPGELITRSGPGLSEAISIARPNIFDRRVKSVAHVDKIAFEGCPRDAQCVFESRKRHDLAVLQQLVDLVESFRSIHRLAAPCGWTLASPPEAYTQHMPFRSYIAFMPSNAYTAQHECRLSPDRGPSGPPPTL